jgi:hypothetical protein
MKTFFTKTKLIAASMVFGLAAASSVNAATITFGGQVATDSSGLTSSKIDSSNIIADVTLGYFVETFDAATAIPAFPSANNTAYNVAGASTGCSINSPLMITQSSPGILNVRKGTVKNVAARPANDDTCYGYTTPAGASPNFVDIDYTAFLATIGGAVPALAGSYIDYLGFYWGSVDTYNTFQFFSDNVLVKQITGSELLAQLGGSSGDQTSDKSNVYVNIDFSPAEAFNKLRVITSGIAGEFDNIVVGLNKRPVTVPAPTGLAILGLGLLGLGLGRRLKK